MQIGAGKLLVIVGYLLSDVPLGNRPLRQSDLHLVHLSPMEHSTRKTVAVELERAALRNGDAASNRHGSRLRSQWRREDLSATVPRRRPRA